MLGVFPRRQSPEFKFNAAQATRGQEIPSTHKSGLARLATTFGLASPAKPNDAQTHPHSYNINRRAMASATTNPKSKTQNTGTL